MDEAIVVFSRKGLCKTPIQARDICSREQARKLWPLVTPDGTRQMVTWISPSFHEGRRRRRSHFRLMPNAQTYDFKQRFEEEESERQHLARESIEHRHAKELIATRYAAQQNTRAARGHVQIICTDMRGDAASDLGHRN